MSRKFLPRITYILTEASGLKLDIFFTFHFGGIPLRSKVNYVISFRLHRKTENLQINITCLNFKIGC